MVFNCVFEHILDLKKTCSSTHLQINILKINKSKKKCIFFDYHTKINNIISYTVLHNGALNKAKKSAQKREQTQFK